MLRSWKMNKENRFVIQVDPLEIEDDAIFDNKELKLYECQSDMMSDICSLLNKQDQQISDLEAKIAERNIEIKAVEFWYSAYQGKQRDYDKVYAELKQSHSENKKIKQQLAEKEKEIAYLTKQVKRFNNEAQKYFEDAYCNDFHNQDKISFAVEQLTQAKDYVQQYVNNFDDMNDCLYAIDNQIKRLTHQHEDKGE